MGGGGGDGVCWTAYLRPLFAAEAESLFQFITFHSHLPLMDGMHVVERGETRV